MNTPPSTTRRVGFRWPPDPRAASPENTGDGVSAELRPTWASPVLESPAEIGLGRVEALRELLREPTRDRTASARQVVVEASRAFVRWLDEAPRPWRGPSAAFEIERGLEPLLEAHGWRGCVARWVDILRATFRAVPEDVDLAAALGEEVGLFAWAADGLARAVGEDGPWDGTPLARGRRLADLDAVARTGMARLERGAVVLVPAHDELVALALEEAARAGLEPAVIVGEGGADGSGKWLARRLARAGVRTTLVYDAALLDKLAWADRVWSGTEAVGAGECVARLGCARLFQAAREEGVPVEVFATIDDLVPGGELHLPAWCARDTWLLWEDAAQGVDLESQLFELVPIDVVDSLLGEAGVESAAELALRGLRTRIQPSLLDPAPAGSESDPLDVAAGPRGSMPPA